MHTHAIGIYDDSLHETELLEEQLIEDFPRAIREKQFQVYYQPKFDVRPETPILSSAEALVRWRHPTLGQPDIITLFGSDQQNADYRAKEKTQGPLKQRAPGSWS